MVRPLQNVYKPFRRKTCAVIIILDNRTSHICLQAISFGKDNNMLRLPLHNSHKTQPLDRNLFKPLKAFYDSATEDWSVCNPGQTLSNYDVAGVFKAVSLKAVTSTML